MLAHVKCKNSTVEATGLLSLLHGHVTKLVGEGQYLPQAEYEVWSEHALSYTVGRMEDWTGIDEEILREVARRFGTSAGLQLWKRADGTVWPDLLYVLPELRKLDKDGSTAELVDELRIQYPKVLSEIGLKAKRSTAKKKKTKKKTASKLPKREVPNEVEKETYAEWTRIRSYRKVGITLGVSATTVGKRVRFMQRYFDEIKKTGTSVRTQLLPHDKRGQPNIEADE